jgi:hypothetical protein
MRPEFQSTRLSNPPDCVQSGFFLPDPATVPDTIMALP